MVSWIRTYYDGSGPVGRVSGYGRIVTTNPSLARRALTSALVGPVLASPGVVDTNSPSRAQYSVSMGLPFFNAIAGLRYTSADVSANPSKNLTASMFIAPASAFGVGVTPTAAQIRDAATTVARAAYDGGFASAYGGFSTTVAKDLTYLDIRTPAFTAQPPNTKFWVMVCPTAVTDMASTPSIANDATIDVAANGRAVSMWTNRTPLAPVITAPAGRTATFAGSEVKLTFSPRDPDRITSFPGDSGLNDFDDMAGVQIQYAPRPTEAVPSPAWTDLPIANNAGTVFGRGWYMDDSAIAAGDEGAKKFWQTRALTIRCGAVNSLGSNAAYLPSGDWQIRIRTFDYGHGWSDADNITVSPPGTAGEPPLGDMGHNYAPDNYPAVNTSPWSEPLRVLVSEQVPAPIAVSPVKNIAVMDTSSVTLSWQYRNTYQPPYVQAKRTVQIRRVGDATWTTLVNDEVSASASLAVSGFALVSGNQYEWHVKVTDTSGVVSTYSDPAYFWVVPAPASGEVIPPPLSTVDGATLGCGTHTITIYRRGGQKRVGVLDGVEQVEWNRVRDDISTSRIIIKNWGVDCGVLLAKLQTWAYEVVIFRNNGYGTERVWEGPITLLTYESDQVVIQAKDVMAYTYRRIIKQEMNDGGFGPDAGATVVDRATRIIQNAFAPDDPNVLTYLQPLIQADDVNQYRSTPAYSRTAFEEVDDMAANAGLDYTAVGRAILLWGTKHRIGTLPEFRDKDLGESPIVSEYGMSMANVYAVSDGNGVFGEANRLNSDGQDPTYGIVEMLSSTWASDAPADTGTYTEAGLATIKASFEKSAERSISDRYPPPVVVRVPDNTRLNPDAVLSIQHLVPGVVVPLRSTSTLRTIKDTQKLDSIRVVEAGGTEAITITLSPFTRDDNAALESGE